MLELVIMRKYFYSTKLLTNEELEKSFTQTNKLFNEKLFVKNNIQTCQKLIIRLAKTELNNFNEFFNRCGQYRYSCYEIYLSINGFLRTQIIHYIPNYNYAK